MAYGGDKETCRRSTDGPSIQSRYFAKCALPPIIRRSDRGLPCAFAPINLSERLAGRRSEICLPRRLRINFDAKPSLRHHRGGFRRV
jgi:hypothetical protein